MDDWLTIFEEIGVILKGHFLLTSGLHSDTYFEKFRLFEKPRYVEMAGKCVKEHFKDIPFDWVCGPTLGGVIFAYEVARQMGINSCYAERRDHSRVLRRGYDIKKGDKILIVDDVLTTGKSLNETINVFEETGVVIKGIAVIIDRREKQDNRKIFSLLRFPVRNYIPEDCSLCKAGIPLTKRGGGKG